MKQTFGAQLSELVKKASAFITEEVQKRGELQVIFDTEDTEQIYGAPCFYIYGKYDSVDRYGIEKLVIENERIVVYGIGASEGATHDHSIPLVEMEDQDIIYLADHISEMVSFAAKLD